LGLSPGHDPGGLTLSDTTHEAPVDAAEDRLSIFDEEHSFADLGLNEQILKGITKAGFLHPTHIQSQLIPPIMAGKDVLGQAKTGTGKTAAFGLPLLHMVEPGKPMQAIILAPTRELAIQITQELEELGRHTKIRSTAVYGGQRIQAQADKLSKGPEIIVGTPGRVIDMVGRGYLNFKGIRFAVLDEVDRMYDIGFRDDIKRILAMCPSKRQTIFVSATISPEIERLVRKHMDQPEKIVTTAGSLTVSMVEQYYLTVNGWDKKRLLHHLLTSEEPALTLVFCRLKRSVDQVAKYLSNKGIDAHAMHGDMSQSKRNSVLQAFKKGGLHVLIASDVASRGIDVDGISHVVNYDLPDDPDLYVHRIGRTARAGRAGEAWSLVTPEEGKLLTQIEILVNTSIPMKEYPDFEPGQKPENWKPDKPPTHYIVEGVEKKQAKSRFLADDGPDIPDDPKALAAKFPGGVIPSKMPPKRLGGRMRTSRGR
jgi:ATP-dependent RNA helicase DeaD